MNIKRCSSIVATLLITASLYGQKKFEVVKIDTTTLETLNVLYIKKNTLFGHKFYRVMTHKKDTLIAVKEKIKVGDVLRLKLVSSKLDTGFTSSPLPKDNENSYFYKDYYEGQKVNVNRHTYDIIDLYYIPQL